MERVGAEERMEAVRQNSRALSLRSGGSGAYGEDPEAPQVEMLSIAGIQQSRQLPFMRLMILWNVCVAVVGGTGIYWAERSNGETHIGWFRCFYVALNSVTATGLAPFDLTHLRGRSLVLVAVCMQLGAMTLLSLLPVVLRIAALEAALPRLSAASDVNMIDDAADDADADASRRQRREARSWWGDFWWWRWYEKRKLVTFDLRKYRLVPQWLVEYKALVFLLRIVVAYHLVVYAVYGTLLTVYVKWTPSAARKSRVDVDAAPTAWAAFHVVSAFNNVGYTLQDEAMTNFVGDPVVLFCLAMLCLHGNVLYPACLRWVIVWLSYKSPKHSNRKVFLRYLLLHGRKLYSSLFSSQATWLLVATQVVLISLQVVITMIVSRNDQGFKNRSASNRINLAAFEAVNCRHAGITALDLTTLHGGTVVWMLCAMWLAPVPFVVALRSSAHHGGGTSGDDDHRQSSDHLAPRVLAASDDGPTVASARHHNEPSSERCALALEDGDASPDGGEERPDKSPHASGSTSAASSRRDVDRQRRRSLGRQISVAFTDADLTEAPPHRREDDEDDAACDRRSASGASSAAGPVLRRRRRIPDAMVDTRALLLERYPDSSPPWRERVSTRAYAFSYHIRHSFVGAYNTVGFTRDASLIFLAWFFVACFENIRPRAAADHLFHAVFELVSAFGNVGLSLGSIQRPAAAVSYSHDLNSASLVVLCLVMIGARTRELPARVDSSLQFQAIAAEDVLRATMVDEMGGLSAPFRDRLRAAYRPPDLTPGCLAPQRAGGAAPSDDHGPDPPLDRAVV